MKVARVKYEENQPVKQTVPQIEISISFCDPDEAPVKTSPDNLPVKEEPNIKTEARPEVETEAVQKKGFKIEAEDSDEDLFDSGSPVKQKLEATTECKVEAEARQEVETKFLAKRDPNTLDDGDNEDEDDDDDDDDLFVSHRKLRTRKLRTDWTLACLPRRRMVRKQLNQGKQRFRRICPRLPWI